MIAVTSETSPLAKNSDYLAAFFMDDYIGGRYSSTSAVGGAVLSLAFGIATWPETLRTAFAGFLVFMVPVVGEGIAAVIVVLREGLSDFIRS